MGIKKEKVAADNGINTESIEIQKEIEKYETDLKEINKSKINLTKVMLYLSIAIITTITIFIWTR